MQTWHEMTKSLKNISWGKMKEVEKKYTHTHIYSGYIKKELCVCVCTCILNKYL